MGAFHPVRTYGVGWGFYKEVSSLCAVLSSQCLSLFPSRCDRVFIFPLSLRRAWNTCDDVGQSICFLLPSVLPTAPRPLRSHLLQVDAKTGVKEILPLYVLARTGYVVGFVLCLSLLQTPPTQPLPKCLRRTTVRTEREKKKLLRTNVGSIVLSASYNKQSKLTGTCVSSSVPTHFF